MVVAAYGDTHTGTLSSVSWLPQRCRQGSGRGEGDVLRDQHPPEAVSILDFRGQGEGRFRELMRAAAVGEETDSAVSAQEAAGREPGAYIPLPPLPLPHPSCCSFRLAPVTISQRAVHGSQPPGPEQAEEGWTGVQRGAQRCLTPETERGL